VAVNGGTVLVGAHYEQGGSEFQGGSAYVFQDRGFGWAQVAKLTADDAQDQDRLGLSVSIDRDVAVVGAWADDAEGPQTGSAYLFEKPSGGWADMTQTARLSASDAADGNHLGWSVAVEGDYVVSGAPANLFDGSGFGAAYVYERPAGGWANTTESAKYTAGDGAQDDRYALSVAVSGSRALVGAPFHKTGDYYGSGAVYVHGGLEDCQPNGVMDACDVTSGGSTDSDGDGVPDECEGAGDGSGDIEHSLDVAKSGGAEITLYWDASCIGTDDDYEIYEGTLGDFESHAARFCSTEGELQATFVPAAGDTYYLVVARNGEQEGSYGLDSDGLERPDAPDACLPRVTTDCP
jgi:hypothetical protein